MAWNKYNVDNECSPKEIVAIIADIFFKKRRQKNPNNNENGYAPMV
jgi:hypothetical protein